MTNKKRFWVSWWQSGVLTYGWKISDKVVANGDKFISVGAVIDLDTFEDDDDVLEAMVWELVSKTIPSFNKKIKCVSQENDWLPSEKFTILPDWVSLTKENYSQFLK